MGEVYRATDLRYGEPVAIKMLVADDASDQHRKRFVREISALRKLYHPNIVGYVDAFASEDRMYLVMEYVGGGTLAHTMQSYGQLPADLFMQIARKVIEAIGSAHELGIVHRDLKPTNILLGVDGEPKVADFGLAKLTNFSTITLGGGAMGTLAYMPPEAFEMQALQDHRGDIWAMGVIFYQMLAGSLPFPGQGKAELVRAILQDPPISLEWFRKDLPPNWYDAIAHCLEKSAAGRYQTAPELLEDLQRPTRAQSATPSKGPPPASGGLLPTIVDFGPDPLVGVEAKPRTPPPVAVDDQPTQVPDRTEVGITPGRYWSRWAVDQADKMARRRRALLPPAVQMFASFLVWVSVVLIVSSSLMITLDYIDPTLGGALGLAAGNLRSVLVAGGLMFILGMVFNLFHVAPRQRLELLLIVALTVANWFFLFSGRVVIPYIGLVEAAMLGTIFFAILIILFFRIQSD